MKKITSTVAGLLEGLASIAFKGVYLLLLTPFIHRCGVDWLTSAAFSAAFMGFVRTVVSGFRAVVGRIDALRREVADLHGECTRMSTTVGEIRDVVEYDYGLDDKDNNDKM